MWKVHFHSKRQQFKFKPYNNYKSVSTERQALKDNCFLRLDSIINSLSKKVLLQRLDTRDIYKNKGKNNINQDIWTSYAQGFSISKNMLNKK